MAAKHEVEKLGYRRSEFSQAVGLSPALVAEMISNGTVKSVKFGAARIIVTTPKEFLASLAKAADKPEVASLAKAADKPEVAHAGKADTAA